MKKVCVVTGAGGVLCSSFAEEMAKQGYAVALLDLNEEAAKQGANDITVGRFLCGETGNSFLSNGSLKCCAVRKKKYCKLLRNWD